MLVKNILVSTLALLLVSSSHAGNLQKAFEALHVFNYFEAKRLFSKQLKKDSIGGGYGLSIIYSRNDNPFYQPDSALKYILLADRKIKTIDEKSKGKLFAVGIDQSEINDQKQRVSELFFKIATDSMTTKVFNTFIVNHQWYRNKANAILIRDSLAFNDAKQKGTWQAYQYFFSNYNKARQVKMARNQYHLLFYADKTQNKTLAEYEKFIQDFPKSPYFGEAQDHIYAIATEGGSKELYYKFIVKYPENRNVDEAWEIIYKKSVKRNDPLEIANFILDFPDYPYRNDALMDYSLSNETFYPVKIGDKWGFIDEKAKISVDPNYDWVEEFSEGLALVGKGNFTGYINKYGKEVVPIKYTDGGTFKGGFAWVELKNKYGLLNNHGVLVLNAVYEDIGYFSEKRIYVQKDGKYGFYNSKMKLAIEHKYNSVTNFKNKRAIVDLEGKKGVIDVDGNTVIDFIFDKIIWEEKTNNYLLEIDGKFGIMDLNADTIIPFLYDVLSNFEENRILFSKDGKYGYLDFMGKEIIAAKYTYNHLASTYASFENGVVKYQSKGKYGLIDSLGKKVYPAIFENIGTYAKITPVKKNGKWGYSNSQVKLLIKYKYSYAEGFNYGLARVQKDHKWGIIDETGNVVIELKYQELNYFGDKLLKVKLEEKWGVLTRNNEMLLPMLYDNIKVYDKNILLLTKKGKRAYYILKENVFLYQEQGF